MGKAMVNFQHFFEIFLWDLESISLLESREEKRWSLLHSSTIVADGIYWFIFSFTEYCVSIGILTHSATWYVSLLREFEITHLFVSQRHNAKCFKGTWIINRCSSYIIILFLLVYIHLWTNWQSSVDSWKLFGFGGWHFLAKNVYF